MAEFLLLKNAIKALDYYANHGVIPNHYRLSVSDVQKVKSLILNVDEATWIAITRTTSSSGRPLMPTSRELPNYPPGSGAVERRGFDGTDMSFVGKR